MYVIDNCEKNIFFTDYFHEPSDIRNVPHVYIVIFHLFSRRMFHCPEDRNDTVLFPEIEVSDFLRGIFKIASPIGNKIVKLW